MPKDAKAKIKALEYMVACAKQAQRTRDPRDKLAAVELEVEFTDRIEKLKLQDATPELALIGTQGNGR